MNVLVLFGRDHPDAVDQLLEGDRLSETAVSIESVAAVVERFEFPVQFDRETVASLRSAPFGELLRDAYLRVVPAERWLSQVEQAAPPDETRRARREAIEWVTFVRGRDTSDGVTLPDDGDQSTLRLSFFALVGGSLQRVSVEYADTDRPTSISTSVPHGCSLPDWGECSGEECGGDCVRELVHVDAYGLRCHCPHEPEHQASRDHLTW